MFSDRFPRPGAVRRGDSYIQRLVMEQEDRDKLDQIELVAGLCDLFIRELQFPDNGRGFAGSLIFFEARGEHRFQFNIPFDRSLEVFYGVFKEWVADKPSFISARAARRPQY